MIQLKNYINRSVILKYICIDYLVDLLLISFQCNNVLSQMLSQTTECMRPKWEASPYSWSQET